MSRKLFFVAVAAVVGVLSAQDPPSRVARLNYVQGAVSFEPGGASEWVQARINRPFTIGDQVFADEGARAEIHVPGIAFRLGSRTAFEFLNLDDRSTQVRLSEGALNISARRLDGDLEVDTPTLAFTIRSPGEYRIDTNPDTLQDYVTIRSGSGDVTTNAGFFPLHVRQTVVVSGQDYRVYAAASPDDFDRWAESREYREQRIQSARYVSPYVVGYEDLDDYGYWESTPAYGSVWIPRAVPVGWAPYQFGHWVWIEPWGWTWVDDEPWGFAPFHYGRWAFFHERWCWVPGPVAVRPVYAPALVAWFGIGGSGAVRLSLRLGGDVGWFPLGPRDVYIPAYRASPAYVTRINTTNTTVINNVQITNVYNNYTRTGSVPVATYANRSVPGAAVAVPQAVLTNARPVQQTAVKLQPNQVNTVTAVVAAPRVAPQQASVLGPAQTTNVPKPSPAVLNKPVVAKTAPPPPPAPLQQRLPLLAKNPGTPIPIQQQEQLGRTAPAATRPAVNVVTQARTVSPPVVNAPPPSPSRVGAVTQQPTTPTPKATQPIQPQQKQVQPLPQVQANRPPETPREQPRAQQQPNRPFEPPTAQPRQAPQPNLVRPSTPPQVQPSRPVEPPAARPQPPQVQANRPPETPREQPRAQQQPNRPFEPPTAQPRQAPQTNLARPSPPPQVQPSRPVEPPPQAQPAPRATPPPAQPRQEPAQARPPDQKKDEKERK